MASRKEKHQPDAEEATLEQEALAEADQQLPLEPGDELDRLNRELEDMKDKYLRVCAEYDNFRKRSIKEREGLYSGALADAVAAFLPVIDNMERACAAVEADEGVRMILKQINGVLEKFSVAPVGEVGDSFDPKLHESVFHQDGDGTGASRITEVLQKGYVMGDRLLRPAMVKTAG